MCTGVELLLLVGGAALASGGAVLQQKGQREDAGRQAMARNSELYASRQRLRGYEDKARQEGVLKALDKFSPENQAKTQDDATARRDVAIQEAVTPTAGVGDIPLEGAPEIIKGDIGKRLRDVFNTATAHAKLAARPLTWQDTLMGNNIGLTEAGRLVDTQNSFARQEAAMLPSQQDFAAFAASKSPSIWPTVMKAAGTAMAGAGGSGYFKAVAPATAGTLLTNTPTDI